MTSILKTLAVALQFGLILISIYEFELISRSFLELSILALGGFLVHAFLPERLRLHFFVLLSLGGVFLVLGMVPALWVIGIGACLLGVALAPLPFGVSVATLVACGSVLIYLRRPEWQGPVPGAVWPILGSIFMFRLIVLVYDLKHAKERPPLKWVLAYIFLLPNPCFPIFPVVDFKKLQTRYYNDETYAIYQRGVRWLCRGVWQLVVYRLVYTRFTIDPVEVDSAVDFLQFALSSFLLYLRVSGQFHIVVGMLLLFGFNLPETHHRYYLASSFTDFWRRINIYWKDFMMKLFYYPAYFRLRRLGDRTALIGATVVVFFSTWILHLFQWYWLRGTVLLEWHDGLFWAVLGLLVIWNSLREAKHGRERGATWATRSAFGNAALVCRTAATFSIICLLWSMWTADSLTQWVELLRAAGGGAIPIVLAGPFFYLLGSWLRRLEPSRPQEPRRRTGLGALEAPFWRSATANGLAALLLAALGAPAVYSYLGKGPAREIAALTQSQLSRRDRDQLERGYYEQLMGANRNSAELWDIYNRRPLDWLRLHETEIWRAHVDNPLLGELLPNREIVFKKGQLSTNRWGMRDRDYELEKPPETYRIAVLGSSHVMGSGVRDGETFENLVENRLNEDPGSRSFRSYELLNFAVAGQFAIQQVFLLEERVLDFEPDALLLVAHGQDESLTARYIFRLLRRGVEVPYPFLRDLFSELGLDSETPEFIVLRRIRPRVREVLVWAIDRMGAVCRERGIEPVWIYLPMIYDPVSGIALEQRIEEARQAGFSTVSLADVYQDHERSELQLASWDDHPNALAHRLVAKTLLERLEAGAALSSIAAPR